MNLNSKSIHRLAATAALAALVTACSSSGDGAGGTNGTGGSTSGTSSSANILDPTQTQLSGVLTGLGNQLSVIDNSGSPLKVGGFVKCLVPVANKLLDGPDGLLTNLLKTVNASLVSGPGALSSTLSPTMLQGGAADLANGLQSLTTTLPNALLTLVGQGSCSGTSTGTNPLAYLQSLATTGGSNNPLAPLQNALISVGVPADGGGSGPTGTPLDIILSPLSKLAGGAGAPTTAVTLATVVNQLASGLITLNNALSTNIPNQLQNAPVVGGALTLVTDALANVGLVLTDLNNPATTNAELLGTVNTLLKDVASTLAVIPGSSTVAAPLLTQTTATVSTLSAVTSPLTSLLATVASIPLGSSSSSTSLTSLTSLLNTSGTSTSTTGTGTPVTSTTLTSIPVIGPILGLLGL